MIIKIFPAQLESVQGGLTQELNVRCTYDKNEHPNNTKRSLFGYTVALSIKFLFGKQNVQIIIKQCDQRPNTSFLDQTHHFDFEYDCNRHQIITKETSNLEWIKSIS